MADPIKGVCSYSPAVGSVDVTVEGNRVTFEHQARGDHGLVGAPFRVRDTFDLKDRSGYTSQRLLAGAAVGDPQRIAIPRGGLPDWRIAYNRCANDLSRRDNPLWRAVRNVANML